MKMQQMKGLGNPINKAQQKSIKGGHEFEEEISALFVQCEYNGSLGPIRRILGDSAIGGLWENCRNHL
jgi:hypothetical protein